MAIAYRRRNAAAAHGAVPFHELKDPVKAQARVRYNKLYRADLPYAGGSQVEPMIAFRKQLIATENTRKDKQAFRTYVKNFPIYYVSITPTLY